MRQKILAAFLLLCVSSQIEAAFTPNDIKEAAQKGAKQALQALAKKNFAQIKLETKKNKPITYTELIGELDKDIDALVESKQYHMFQQISILRAATGSHSFDIKVLLKMAMETVQVALMAIAQHPATVQAFMEDDDKKLTAADMDDDVKRMRAFKHFGRDPYNFTQAAEAHPDEESKALIIGAIPAAKAMHRFFRLISPKHFGIMKPTAGLGTTMPALLTSSAPINVEDPDGFVDVLAETSPSSNPASPEISASDWDIDDSSAEEEEDKTASQPVTPTLISFDKLWKAKAQKKPDGSSADNLIQKRGIKRLQKTFGLSPVTDKEDTLEDQIYGPIQQALSQHSEEENESLVAVVSALADMNKQFQTNAKRFKDFAQQIDKKSVENNPDMRRKFLGYANSFGVVTPHDFQGFLGSVDGLLSPVAS